MLSKDQGKSLSRNRSLQEELVNRKPRAQERTKRELGRRSLAQEEETIGRALKSLRSYKKDKPNRSHMRREPWEENSQGSGVVEAAIRAEAVEMAPTQRIET